MPTDQLRDTYLTAAAREVEAHEVYRAAREACRLALDAWAASLTEIKPGEIVERVKEWGTPVERRGKPATRWRVDSIKGEEPWGADRPPGIKLYCTYIGKDGQPGKRTAKIPVGDVRRVEQ